jgi:ribonuclease D
MGLNNHRDRLCLVQLSDGEGDEHSIDDEVPAEIRENVPEGEAAP